MRPQPARYLDATHTRFERAGEICIGLGVFLWAAAAATVADQATGHWLSTMTPALAGAEQLLPPLYEIVSGGFLLVTGAIFSVGAAALLAGRLEQADK